jgi:hypothetical protein
LGDGEGAKCPDSLGFSFVREREPHEANTLMGILKSKGLWLSIGVTILTIAAVNRITVLRNFVYGTA